MTDAATIAAGLTKAQREAVLALYDNSWQDWTEGRLAAMLDGLGKHGLNQLRDLGLAFKGPPWRLTDLGLAVRAEILATLKDTDHG